VTDGYSQRRIFRIHHHVRKELIDFRTNRGHGFQRLCEVGTGKRSIDFRTNTLNRLCQRDFRSFRQ
jgi:hypothetical protein